MEKVRGVGGVFFKAADPKALGAWYRDNLGIPVDPNWGGAVFTWSELEGPGEPASTVWSPFKQDTTYFAPSTASFMINFRVGDLDAMVAQLKANGCDVADEIQDTPQGRFGWVMDPEGNRIELWEPPKA